MLKEVRKAKARPNKKVKTSPTPALLTALALLSVSLRVTDGTPAGDLRTTPNTGESAAGVKLADKITTLARASQLAAIYMKYGNIKGDIKTKKLEAKPSNKMQSNQHKSPTSNRKK